MLLVIYEGGIMLLLSLRSSHCFAQALPLTLVYALPLLGSPLLILALVEIHDDPHLLLIVLPEGILNDLNTVNAADALLGLRIRRN